nr:permease [Treponema vincentii]
MTFSFLISSPMVDLGSLVLLMSIFGWKIAIAYVLFGLVIAVVGGTIIEKLHLENEVADFIKNGKSNEVSEEKISQKERLNLALRSVFETLKKVFPYIIAGVAIGAFIHNWIPQNWIETVLGKNNPLGVVLATVLGAPMYADIFGCIPIAESLLVKGAMLGVVLSFMMAVTTLSLPSLVMLKKVVKGKLLFVFIAICVIGIILVGYLFNALQVLFI